MENIPQPESEREKYQQRNAWAEALAKDLGVSFTGEFFEVSITDVNGAPKKRMIHAWKKLPLYNDKGEQVRSVGIEVAIDATRRFPDLPLSEAIKMLENGIQTENTSEHAPESAE
ncbi:MAG: hypothetical protein COW88_01620 [Candidatus Lloydbacteria bacterium CG22_combo_CG10-13_8_21_14_all_47_15]|uniref:Uncharacterized protein n=1 Tax=Candidatus Lloydbacteria bacterium CG22_combo_CG10-13_8_21_14_all_47_15 TaxID=1974635 RepID=A0A2H0CUV8_9BACT|nr:MAG: hypothetical protein COW88_01620 [Candidatus Lloydbacteria bacterium CG22_combo_CG10-13_8_21_14_all_47_15]